MQARDGIRGSVAELGVWRGECARYINHCFNDERFYLLDTFEGFDARDIAAERGAAKSASTNDFANTSLESVRSNLIYPDKCVFVKGYFPQTATQIPQDEVFRFVNIDVDLYQPILAGLEFFYPRLVGGGAILVHDYFHPFYTGTRLAVDEFCTTHALKPLPIGDGFSVMITKPL